MEQSTTEDLPCLRSTDHMKIKVYKKRWLVLFTFSINSFANALLFTSLTSVNDIVSKYYQVKPSITDWAANAFEAVFVLIAIPSSQCASYFGIRTLIIIGSSLNAICTCFHFAGLNRDGFYYVITGQFIAGFSVGAILQVPAKLSTVWFPEHEHAKATAIAMSFNVLGLGVGYLQPCYMVPDSPNPDDVYNGLYKLYISQMVFLGVCLLSVYLFFDEKPLHPPSHAAAIIFNREKASVPGLLKSLKTMASDKNFVIFSQVFGLYFGGYNFFMTCFNEMCVSIIDKTDIGWVGFSGNMSTIIGILLFSTIVDKYKRYQKVSMLLLFGTFLSWALFSLVTLHWKSYYLVYLSFNLLCFFGSPFFVIGVEYTAELTYPITEDLSSAIVFIFGNTYGLVYVIVLGRLVDNGNLKIVCCIVFGLYVLAFIMVCFVKQNLKRHSVKEIDEEIVVAT